MTADSETLALARALIQRASVTPDDAGCQALIAERLAALGFTSEAMPFGEVQNQWSRYGNDGPLFAFAGHTDVVPPGPEANWSTPPFEPHIRDGMLYGRGAADMKGSLAAFVTACERFLARQPDPAGSIAMLLTSDEEGPARDGTRRVVETLQAREEVPQWCVVGEPTSDQRIADTLRNGRRGSLTGELRVHGIQGHVAYPHRARNPVHDLAPALTELVATEWDQGDRSFPPTSFQVAGIQAGTGADNVIPGSVVVRFNLRFSPQSTPESIQARVEAILAHHDLEFELEWSLSARPFATEDGALLDATRAAVSATTGREPVLSTGGGTSDGRFIAPAGAQVIELGPANATIHQVDEHVAAADLDTLSAIYEAILDRLVTPSPAG
ncbi:MAG: succinyl-diaminopimelate desuccinylase [Ectothiorhodospiraceae bacterium]